MCNTIDSSSCVVVFDGSVCSPVGSNNRNLSNLRYIQIDIYTVQEKEEIVDKGNSARGSFFFFAHAVVTTSVMKKEVIIMKIFDFFRGCLITALVMGIIGFVLFGILIAALF